MQAVSLKSTEDNIEQLNTKKLGFNSQPIAVFREVGLDTRIGFERLAFGDA